MLQPARLGFTRHRACVVMVIIAGVIALAIGSLAARPREPTAPVVARGQGGLDWIYWGVGAVVAGAGRDGGVDFLPRPARSASPRPGRRSSSR